MEEKISIIIPVLNELSLINHTLSHLYHRIVDRNVEVIVVDGDPDGKTLDIISYDYVRKLTGQKGRGAQINTGAFAATGEILLFLHADTILPENALDDICHVMAQPNRVGGAFNLGIASEKFAFRIIEGMVFWRTRLTRIPYGDQGIFLQTDFFKKIGGCQEIPLMEDVELMGRVKRSGGRIEIISSKVLTSSRRWEREGVIRCTLRNWLLISLYLMGISSYRLAKFYR